MADRTSPFTTTARLRDRVTEALLAQARFSHAGLNAFLREHLGGSDKARGALVAEPVVEGVASYIAAGERLSELSGTLLHPDVVAALTRGKTGDDYRFDPALQPYQHQLESWRHLAAPEPRSVLVTSGTGSGKTECFLVPLLDDLAREAAAAEARLSGVRAIMLYPLNALIASQRERLRRWTEPFKGRIRFGMYNRLMEEDLRQGDRAAAAAKHPEEVMDRKTLRADPPPVLVTNVTMLEYLTIRPKDRPLLEASRGKLRWIIIDEAHSYVGSNAAEVALLLRRVLHAFGVKAEDVRFVATSATLGSPGEEQRKALARFLADLSGAPPSRVRVVEGGRAPVELPDKGPDARLTPASLADHAALKRHPRVQAFIRAAEKRGVPLAEARRMLGPTGVDVVAVLEAMTENRGKGPLLPLRVHQFMRAVPGLWSCLNPACAGPKPDAWPFGAPAFEQADHCAHCRSPLFEVEGCRECGEPFLAAFEQGDRLVPVASTPDPDEFAAASERESEDADPDPEGAAPKPSGPLKRRLIGLRLLNGMAPLGVESATGVMPERAGEGISIPLTKPNWDGCCPNCRKSPPPGTEATRPFRFGAPFLIGNAAPVMLDGVAPAQKPEGMLPAGGRRLLSFTDSRQGTARFAASIETNAERAYVRAFIYHLAQKSAQGDPGQAAAIADKRRDAEMLERLGADNPSFADAARRMRAELDALTFPTKAGIGWTEARTKLAQDPIIQTWIRAVWQDRDPRFHKDPEALAGFLLLRELARRPRQANAVETLGLARLRFPPIDKLGPAMLPEPLRRRGRTIEEWRDFLYAVIDTPLRTHFALNVSRDDVRWLLPRGGVRRNVVGPGEDKRNPSDLMWPRADGRTNPVLLLQARLGIDNSGGEGRAEIDELLRATWDALRPVLDHGGSEYALDLAKAQIAPVTAAFLCPVTRRVLTRLAFGATPFGHRENSPFAGQPPEPLRFPALPLAFPRNEAEREHLAAWAHEDPDVAALRAKGVWRDLHDRAAVLSDYVRAEEHSAQQPPARLRGFEEEFKAGKINMLACSTTMEMGVDIGPVSAVVMTNVPPSIANYRQRVGRAGRRGQPFASSLTLAKDTPLDRETFRKPEDYLSRELRPPQVKLDAPRIVQRHVNAFLLARWFAGAQGELLKAEAGAFFGFPDGAASPLPGEAPVAQFCGWLRQPGTRAALKEALHALTRGTALDGNPGLHENTEAMFEAARTAFQRQWDGLRSELEAAPSDAARKSIDLQIKRLCRESLLRALTNLSLLPGHGFPTSVISFVNHNHEAESRKRAGNAAETPGSRYDYPSRNTGTAIREYAPGAEVVIDGLVWRSAGVTLNWKRPADEDALKDIQSLRHFWQCRACGAADCGHARVERCPACGATDVEWQKFLEPAGFRVDWSESPHADTDMVTFIEPETPRIAVRGAQWEPLLNPALGRFRCSSEGLVYFGARGASKRGYRICLDCGRAEEEPGTGPNPLDGHSPLRGQGTGKTRTCDGAGKSFTMLKDMSLGHEVLTDVAEVQPAALDAPGAWALASALREALAQQLGIQPGELGFGVEKRQNAQGGRTHSVFLFDSNAGGAGFATRLMDDPAGILARARGILNCQAPGCEHGCAACVLVSDLYEKQGIVDRRPALACVDALLQGMRAPPADDTALPHARLSPPVADGLARRISRGDTVTLYAADTFDLGALGEEPFAGLWAATRQRGASVRLALPQAVLAALNPAHRQGLRDAGIRHGFGVWQAAPPRAANGAALLATLLSGGVVQAWFTRDEAAQGIGAGWGSGQVHPVVQGTLPASPAATPVSDGALAGTGKEVHLIEDTNGRPLKLFGGWFTKFLAEKLEPLGLWRPGELRTLAYSDRYLRSPLSVALSFRALAGLRDALAGKGAPIPVSITSAPLDPNRTGLPNLLSHDWRRPDDRKRAMDGLARHFSFDAALQLNQAGHPRELVIGYRSGPSARIFLDQGFGYWQASSRDRFDFTASPAAQARALDAAGAFVAGRDSSYLAISAIQPKQ